jgi:hypothetical protein
MIKKTLLVVALLVVALLLGSLSARTQNAAFFGSNAPAAGGGGAAHVQSCGFQTVSSFSQTVTCTFSAPVGASHFVYLCVDAADTPMPAITWTGDSGSASLDLASVTFSTSSSAACYYIAVTGGGETIITGTLASGLAWPAVTGDEFSGVTTIDNSDAGATGTGTTATSNSITPSHNGDIVVGHIVGNGNPTITAGTNVAYVLGGQSGFTSANEWYIQPTAAGVTATASLSATSNWLAHVVALH